MEEPKKLNLDMDIVAKWLGWDQINLRLAQEQIISLSEENQRLVKEKDELQKALKQSTEKEK